MGRFHSANSTISKLILAVFFATFLLTSCLSQVGMVNDIPEAAPAEETIRRD